MPRRAVNSAVRVRPLQGRSRGFESLTAHSRPGLIGTRASPARHISHLACGLLMPASIVSARLHPIGIRMKNPSPSKDLPNSHDGKYENLILVGESVLQRVRDVSQDITERIQRVYPDGSKPGNLFTYRQLSNMK